MRVLEFKPQHAFVSALIRARGRCWAAVVSGTKIARLGNRSTHRDRSRVVRASVGAKAAARPAGKTEARIRVCLNNHARSGITPAAGRLHCAARSRTHRQEVLRLERCRVGLVRCRRDHMGDRSIVTPLLPQVLHTGPAALR